MSHGINAYYRNVVGNPAHVQPTPAPKPAAPSTDARQAEATASARAARATGRPGDLSDVEAQMINRYFPASESMSLRLYGPGQEARTLNPATLGSRLDLQG